MSRQKPVMDIRTIFGDGGRDEFFQQKVLFEEDSQTENRVINLYPEARYGTFEGFGGAVTDSAGYVYSLMSEAQKKELMETYFSPERMNYQFLRVPMDSCDFSLEQYEAMSDPFDVELKSFSMERPGKYILPMLEDAYKAAGRQLPLLLSPWSPPVFMKTNGLREQGGALKEEHRDLWAEYLCRYIEEFKKRGFHVQRLTLQNEPKAVQTWDSCIYTAQDQKVFLRDYMRPAMVRHSLTDVEVYLWDHNKERVYEWMRDIIDDETSPMIAGAACHWYSGDHFEALDLCRERFPDKKLIVSESCLELYIKESGDAVRAAQRAGREVLGDINHGVSAFYDWNLLLDEQGGPNYVENYCLAPFIYDTAAKKLQPQLVQKYYECFSHYLLPGSVRIGMSRYADDIKCSAWQRPDGSLLLFMMNESTSIRQAFIRLDGTEAAAVLYPQSLSAAVIEQTF